MIKKRSNSQIAVRILNYVETLGIDNYQIKTELLIMSGKVFKSEKNYDKALIAFEECFYMANLNEDYKLKIKSIVSISSCYLEMSDLHKVIYYYHKLIDIESYLLNSNNNNSSNSINSPDLYEDSMINLELRVAIRQNLFTAHYRLGKIRVCCYYLNEIIEIIDKELNLTETFLIESESFEFIQIKIDASIELIKLYLIFDEFIQMKHLLDKILKFIEYFIDEESLSVLNDKQLNKLKYFKIKCFSYLGVCLAGLRDYRLSKLSTRKCLCLIDKEIQSKAEMEVQETDLVTTNLFVLNSLKVECLIDACEASNQIIKTFKEMKEFNFDLGSDLSNRNPSKFDAYELKILTECNEQRVKNSKSAYLLSKTLIDPSLRAYSTFTLALSLYENQFYQSAAYYFNEVLSIPTVLLDNKTSIENRFYTDANPDYRLESSVYLYKCQLLIDFYDMESLVTIPSSDGDLKEDQTQSFKSEKVDLDNLFKKLRKSVETLVKHYLKWKLHETNRSSFLFNISHLEKIKQDDDSVRLRNLIKICTECMIYVCYKLNKKEECLVYMEFENFILTSSMSDLIDLKLIDAQNQFNFSFLSFENFTYLLNKIENNLLRYKFIFECKIMYIFMLKPNNTSLNSIAYFNCIKMSQMLSKIDVNQSLLKIYDSKFDYLSRKLDLIQNERIKEHLHEIEYRNCPSETNDLAKLRIQNRLKENNYFDFMLKSSKNELNFIYDYNLDSIDLVSLKLSEKLKENVEKIDLDKMAEITKTDFFEFELKKKLLVNSMKYFLEF